MSLTHNPNSYRVVNMTQENDTPKIVFAPGLFDDFEGTQDELDELIEEIMAVLTDPETLKEMSSEVDLDELEEEDAELFELVITSMNNEERNKKLN